MRTIEVNRTTVVKVGVFVMAVLIIFAAMHRGPVKTSTKLKSRHAPQRQVLLLCYMKGGSTFLGQMFQQHPDALYWYEPNAGLYRQKFFNAVIYPLSIFYDRTKQDEAVPRKSDEQDLQIMDQLMDIMSCKFSDTPQYFFSSFGIKTSTDTRRVAGCVENQIYLNKKMLKALRVIRDTCHDNAATDLLKQNVFGKACSRLLESLSDDKNASKKGIYEGYKLYQTKLKSINNHCSKRFTPRCKAREFQVSKVLRWRMQDLQRILKNNPRLSLVHYIRDPRGIIASKIRNGYMTPYGQLKNTNVVGIKHHARILCHKMLADIKAKNEIEHKYPGRILTVKYEDLAMEPVKGAKEIYNWLGMRMAKPVARWINQNTHAEENFNRGDAITKRKNSTWEAISWKRELDKASKLVVTEECLNVIKELDYDVLYVRNTNKKVPGNVDSETLSDGDKVAPSDSVRYNPPVGVKDIDEGEGEEEERPINLPKEAKLRDTRDSVGVGDVENTPTEKKKPGKSKKAKKLKKEGVDGLDTETEKEEGKDVTLNKRQGKNKKLKKQQKEEDEDAQ